MIYFTIYKAKVAIMVIIVTRVKINNMSLFDKYTRNAVLFIFFFTIMGHKVFDCYTIVTTNELVSKF